MTNEQLTTFNTSDPISSHGLMNGGALDVTGGNHRLAEIAARVKDGRMDPSTTVEIMLHD